MPTRARRSQPADPDMPEIVELTKAQRRALAGPPLASPFDPYDRLFGDYQSGLVFDYGSADARQLDAMLEADGTAKQLEQVLTLPLRGADWEIVGKGEHADRVRAQFSHDEVDHLLAQMTSAVVYRKAFFESTWSLDGADVRCNELAFRPASSCEAAWQPATGREAGFRQRVGNPGGMLADPYLWSQSAQPGYIQVPQQRSFIYTHGTHRQPKKGISDLAVAWWAYETRRKVLFLWLQFLETQSLPKVLFFGADETLAKRNAAAFAQLKGGGTLGMKTGADPSVATHDVVESNGQGASQFLEAIRYLEQQMVDSVLAGFTKLAGAAASGTGSYALSADQSEFFTVARQGVADEMATQVRRGAFGPLVVYNNGGAADVPTLKLGPLSRQNTQRALDLLTTIITAPEIRVPDEFTDQLLLGTATLLGLDIELLQRAVDEHAVERTEDKKVKREQAKALFEQQKAGMLGPPGSQTGRTPGNGAGRLATAASVGTQVVRRARAGQDPKDALRAVRARTARVRAAAGR